MTGSDLLVARTTRTRTLLFMATLLVVVGALSFFVAQARAVVLPLDPDPLPGSPLQFQGGDGDQLEALPETDWNTLGLNPRHFADPQADDNIFDTGSKITEPIDWDLGTKDGGSTPGKDNILDAYVKLDPAANGDLYVYLAFTRFANNGTTYMGYELNQNPDTWTNAEGEEIPCRTTGDIIIAARANGNDIDLSLETWTTTSLDPNGSGCAATGTLTAFDSFTADEAQGHMNEAAITDFLPGFAWSGNTIPKQQFGEAALNLTALLTELNDSPCFSFGSIWMHTRSSTAIDSNLNDYIPPSTLVIGNCTASGVKYNDVNGNGSRDAGEPGLAGFRIWADYDNDGVLDAGEPFDDTDATGAYSISGIQDPSGTYSLREMQTPPATGTGGWICSQPTTTGTGGVFPCAYTGIDGSATPNVTGKDFGNYRPGKIELDKEADAGTVDAGEDIGFTLTVTNTGAGLAHDVTLTDTLPSDAGLSWSEDPDSADCSITGGVLSCDFGDLAPGASASVHISSPTTFASCGVIDNTGMASSDGSGSDEDSDSVTVECPDLELTKEADAASVSAGDEIGFTVTVTNNGPGVAKGVTIDDPLPTGSGVVWSEDPDNADCEIVANTLSCDFGDLASGASRTVHVSSPTTSESCKAYPNTASLSADNHPDLEDSATTTVNCGEIEISKTADSGTVNAGEPIGFTITVHNKGAGTLHDVTVTDTLPDDAGLAWSESPDNPDCSISAGVLTCDFGDLAPDASRTVHISSPTTFASCGEISNTASVTTSNDGSGESTDDVTVQCPDLEIVKEADATSVSAGDQIGFTITVTNNGPGTAKGVTLDDPLPTGTGISWSDDSADCSITADTLSCDFGDLGDGESASVHVTSPTTKDSCKAYPNTATASADNHPDVEDSATTTVNCGDIEISKVADAGTVNAGDPIGFTITVHNKGAGTAKGVTVTDTLPDDAGLDWSENPDSPDCSISAGVLTCAFGDLAPDASASVHISSSTTFDSCGEITNTASVSTTNDGSGESTDSVTVECPDLEIVKEADAASVSAGDEIGFTVTVTNNGPGTAANVSISDPLPTGTGVVWSEDPDSADCEIVADALSCDFGDLADGESASVHVSSPTTKDSCKAYPNTASLSADNHPDLEASATTTVNCGGIAIVKEADAGSVNAGEDIGFTITVTSTGAGTAKGVTVTDTLPSDAGLSWTEDSAACSISAGVLTCDFGDLAPEESASVHISSPTTADSCGVIENTASVSTTNDGSSSSTDSVTVDCPAIQVVKSGPDTVYHGDQAKFTFKVSNPGTVGLTDVVVTDDKCSPVQGPTAKEGGDQNAVLDPGEVWTYACTMTIAPHQSGEANPVVNTVTATGTDRHGGHPSDTDTHSTRILHPAIDIEKTGPATATQGDVLSYTLTVKNTGDSPFVSVVVTDPNCDDQPTLVSKNGDPTPGTLDPGTDTWTYTCSHLTTTSESSYTNTANVTGTDRNNRKATDSDTVTTDIAGQLPVVPGTARLRGPSGCVRGPFKATVRGTKIARVTFFLDGKRFKRINAKTGQTRFQATINPRGRGFGVHRVTARVQFTAESNTSTRTLRLSFQRCKKRVVRPRFTG
jgi:uncharacterized repeat protein (TIGR01451 family)